MWYTNDVAALNQGDRMTRRFLLLVCVAIASSACGENPALGSAVAVPTAAATVVAAAPSLTATAPTAPSATAAPTATTAPSATTAPTDAPTATLAAVEPSAPVVADDVHDTASLAAPADQEAPVAVAPVAADAAVAATNPVRLVIEPIGLDRKLLSVGLDKNRVPIVPKHDIAWYNLSARPGQGENVVMWGHVLRFKNAPKIPAPFARLKELSIGARITVYNGAGRAFHYVVSEKVYARPDQVEYILPVGSERLTLVSCIGDKVVVDGSVEMSHRLITIAVPEK